MKTKRILLLLFFVLISVWLTACIATYAPDKSGDKSEIKPNMTIDQAINIINSYFPRDKVTLDGITIISDGKQKGFYYPFKNSEELQIYPENLLDPDGKTRVWLLSAGKKFSLKFKKKSDAMEYAGAVYYLKHLTSLDLQREFDDCMRVIRSTPINVILSGATAYELAPTWISMENIESLLNEILIEWKNKGLRELLQKGSSSQFSDLVINLEKGILKLDLEAKKLKDLADEDARQVQAPGEAAPAKKEPEALAAAHLLEQRKTILMVILGSVKQAAARRASEG